MQEQPAFKIPVTKLKCPKLTEIQRETIAVINNLNLSQFCTCLGVQTIQQSDTIVLSGKLSAFNLINTKNITDKIFLLKQIVQAVICLHKKGYCLNCGKIQDILLLDQLDRIRLLSHKFLSSTESIVKKTEETTFQLPEISLEKVEPGKREQIDVWRIGKFALKYIWDFDINQACENIVKNKDQKAQRYAELVIITKKLKFQKEQQIQDKIKGMLKVYPRERIELVEVVKMLKEFLPKGQSNFTQTTKKIAKKKYLEWQAKIEPIFIVQIKDHVLLTEQLIKKLGNHFKVSGKAVSKMKPIFRGSLFEFSSKLFYQQVSAHENVLIVVLAKNQKVKICGYSPNAFDLKNMNGIFGGFIADTSGKSFLYNCSFDDFYKLKDTSKAIGVSMINGPIFGNGDLVIGDKGIANTCRFPTSYETGKKKSLFKGSTFQIEEYDVFRIQFIEKEETKEKVKKKQ